MDKIFEQFGIQPILLLAQIVNFLVLLFILNKLLYKPLLKVLADRRQKIEESLKNAEEIEKRLIAISEEEEKRIQKAAEEGQKIIKRAEEAGIELIAEAKVKAESMAEKIIRDAQSELALEREKIRQEMREHMAGFVTLALEKVTGKVIDKSDQKKMINDSLKGMN